MAPFPMTFRKLLFWVHCIAGTIAGAIVLVMSVTGVALTYERQIVNWSEHRYHVTGPAPVSGRLTMSALLDRVRSIRPALPSSITVRAEPAAPVELGYGRETTLFVHPYTGAVLGDTTQGLRPFFRAVTDWHRWLGTAGAGRATGRAITGACNLAFLFLVITGCYLWLPKQWTWQRLRPIVWFRTGLSGKPRDFNWHNVAGLWCAVPLFFIVLSGVIMSYPWANNLLYTLTGSTPPARAGGPPGGGESAAGWGGAPAPRGPSRARSTDSHAADSQRRHPREDAGEDGRPQRPSGPDLTRLDAGWDKAKGLASSWRSITLRLPPSARAPWTFAIDTGNGGEPEKRMQVSLDAATLEVTRTETFSGYELGRKLRMWARFIHTGEEFGVVGQTIAGIASAGASLLVWTGIALAWRRFRRWRARKAERRELVAR